ncbi:MAG: hypothetical protein U5N86_06920 [Planctomycetota bacterium]|nr:hypothetical protein [Planctomycetota bacterium]
MRHLITLFTFMFALSVFTTPALAEGTDVNAKTKIDAVTVLPQRAEIVRTAEAELQAGLDRNRHL